MAGLLLAACLLIPVISAIALAFRCREYPRFLHGVSINLVSSGSSDHERCTFAEICQQAIPVCELNPFLLGSGHLHTLWNLVAARNTPPCYFRRVLIEQKDPRYPGSFAIDFFVREHDPTSDITRAKLPPHTTLMSREQQRNLAKADSRPLLIILPGLGGGSEEEYLRETCQSLTSDSDWEVAVINSRGCSRTTLTSQLFYHAGSTWDLAQAVRWLTELFPERPLYALGFSLGGNILTNYIADSAENCILQAAMTISNPWDLEKALDSLQTSFFGRETYLAALGTTLKRKVLANAKQIQANSEIDLDAVRRAKYLPDFDAAVQLPMWGFSSVRDYYRKTSSAHRVAEVAIPFLAVNAMDDPIAAGNAIPDVALGKSAYTVLCTTQHGGHVGWHCLRGNRWIAGAARGFFDEMREWQLKKEIDESS
ncbi:putative esterase [Lachnellula suecica]|uniref:Putative esterase n=1 Tax=Lachnellula suecica TaxID=602035 RepID=A0A8T9CEX0_9HELO|nr:putative esterase [Lachnellula suecica]